MKYESPDLSVASAGQRKRETEEGHGGFVGIALSCFEMGKVSSCWLVAQQPHLWLVHLVYLFSTSASRNRARDVAGGSIPRDMAGRGFPRAGRGLLRGEVWGFLGQFISNDV